MTKGIATTNINVQTALDEVLGNTKVGGVESTVRVPFDDVAKQLRASPAFQDIDDLSASGDTVTKATWAQLSAVTGSRDGQRGFVEADNGTHTDPVVGGIVQNKGIYTWSTAPAGWRWLRNDDVSLLIADKSIVSSIWDPLDDDVLSNADLLAAAQSVRDIQFENTPTHPVRLVTLSKNDPFGKDNIIVRDADGVNWSNTEDKGDPPSGIQSIVLTATDKRRATIVIDYARLPANKLYVNNSSSKLVFSRLTTRAVAPSATLVNQLRAGAPWLDPSVSDADILTYQVAIRAIRDVALMPYVGEKRRISILTYDDPIYYTRASVRLEGKADDVFFGVSLEPKIEGGLVRVDFGQGGSSARGLGALWFDPTGLSKGIILSLSNSPLLINPSYVSPRWQTENNIDAHPDQLRLCCAGSSITWGQGYVGEGSFVGVLERHLRTKLATTYTADQLHSPNQTITLFRDEKMNYQGMIGRLSGANAYAQCRLYGNEISISVAKERGNQGAAIVELLVDGKVHDTFSTFNALPYGAVTRNFTADGSQKVFDLGLSGTYGHTLTVDGITRAVQLYDRGLGVGFQSSDYALVIRKAVSSGDKVEVRHFLTLKDTPPNGAAISCSFNYGETISSGKSTVQNKLRAIGSGLESSYGDGDVAYDPASPAAFSSGLDFRHTDERSIHTWRFTDKKIRDVSFRIKKMDPRGTGTVPELFICFVTNRCHMIMNAGIGGARADDWLDTTDLKTIRQIAAFKPSHIVLESGTNDDWREGSWQATRVLAGQTNAQIRSVRSASDLLALSGSGNAYTSTTSHVLIESVTPFSIKFSAGQTLNLAANTDVIILGDFSQDQRRVCARVVSDWNAGTRTATFKEELTADDLIYINELSELVGKTCQVRRITGWVDNVSATVSELKSRVPDARIGIGTCGIPNVQHRLLEGYREVGLRLAAELGVDWIDFYRATKEWVYSQVPTRQLYLNASKSSSATGANSYVLYNENGTKPNDFTLRNARIFVDDIDRTNDGVIIRGGYKNGWAEGVDPLTMNNRSFVVAEHVLEFSSNQPASGSQIQVYVNAEKWAADDCHPASPNGFEAFAQAIMRRWNEDFQTIA